MTFHEMKSALDIFLCQMAVLDLVALCWRQNTGDPSIRKLKRTRCQTHWNYHRDAHPNFEVFLLGQGVLIGVCGAQSQW